MLGGLILKCELVNGNKQPVLRGIIFMNQNI